mmetsp:Transcript_130737/g.244610  ORF Transcript_130737/g.244610 Transcript_130737/m.244610 type:complete len:726 (+) Transcript_130737:85-2262(+)
MKLSAICSLCILSSAAALTFRTKAQTGSPVERVVTLLKDLASEIETDSKVEQKMYDKYACWCEKTAKRKATDIEDGLDDMRALSQEILTLKGLVATRKAEIAERAQQIADTEAAMEEATNLRSKQNSAFMAESAEMKDALAALQSAITVLVKATLPGAASLVQEESMARSRMAIRAVLNALPSRVDLPVDHVSMLSTFTTAASGYAPQSATIQGILSDMYTTFSADLESSTKLEAERNADYELEMSLKAKTKADLEKVKARKEAELAEAEANLADASKEYDDTFGQKEADIKLFDETKKACTVKFEEWSLRKELRAEEVAGIEKAIEILTADEARDTFQVAIKPGKETGADASIDPLASFFQVSNVVDATAPSVKAYNVLKARATKSHSLRLAMLAVQVRTAKVGHFDGVIKAIDEMMDTLKTEGAADLDKKTTCLDEYQEINLTVSDLDWKIEVNDATIAKLEAKIEKLTKSKLETIAEIDATNNYITAITKIRDEQHDEFVKSKADDQQAVGLLTEAKTALFAYYKNRSIALGPIQGAVKGLSLRQAQDPVFSVSEDQAPDATLSGKGSHKGEAKDILSLMTYLIEDLEDEIRNGVTTEASQQAAYEEEKATALNLIDKLEEKKLSLEKAISKAGEDKVAEETLKGGNLGDKAAQESYHSDIKPDCDWIIGAFDKRAEARAAEMTGLTEAKEYLAGQSSLLEKRAQGFDDNKLSSIRFLGLRH